LWDIARSTLLYFDEAGELDDDAGHTRPHDKHEQHFAGRALTPLAESFGNQSANVVMIVAQNGPLNTSKS
jgi:hypothetical protein